MAFRALSMVSASSSSGRERRNGSVILLTENTWAQRRKGVLPLDSGSWRANSVKTEAELTIRKEHEGWWRNSMVGGV